MASSLPAFRSSERPHIHIAGEICPVCDQPIPNEKLQVVREKMKAREQQLDQAAKAKAAQELAALRQQIEADAKAKVDKAQADKEEALRIATEQATLREATARDAGKKEAEEALQGTIAANSKAAAEWREKAEAAERARRTAIIERDNVVTARVQEVRDAMAKDKTEALNTQAAQHFSEMQKANAKADDLKRQLEKKTAEELGEGAEVNLFEALKAEFGDTDIIERVTKGASGADIIHTVKHNNQECGRIIFDCKDTNAWRSDYLAKLVQDQTAAKADYAILCTRKFPAGKTQLTVRENVIIVNPAHAVAVVQIIRRNLLHMHCLRLSKSERAKKMAALYDYIVSPRCAHLLERIDSHAEALLTLQLKEITAHNAHWKQEASLARSIQKVKAELQTDIDGFLGTADPAE